MNLIGRTFGRLLVLSESAPRRTPVTVIRMFCCRCECGNHRIVQGRDLTSGKTRSCTCLSREITSAVRRVHGHSNGLGPRKPTRTYTSWQSMKERCYNPDATSWRWYGAKGVRICDRWRFSFENFLADLGERPEGMSLDRIDNEHGYEPGNCRWATPLQQTRNRSITVGAR